LIWLCGYDAQRGCSARVAIQAVSQSADVDVRATRDAFRRDTSVTETTTAAMDLTKTPLLAVSIIIIIIIVISLMDAIYMLQWYRWL